jgi:hypothetical protein
MGGQARERRDALLELETAIYDQIDERVDSGEIPEEAVQDVLDALGDPAEVGSQYMPQPPLLAPHQTRPFLVNLVALFSVHFLLVIGASVSGHAFSVPPIRIDPIANPKMVLPLLARALETLLFDAGLLLCVFALVPRLGRLLRVKTVRPNARRCIEGAFFLTLVLVVVNFLRDNMLALYVPTNLGTQQLPLVGPAVVANLFWINAWLGLAVARELLYAWRGERKATITLDVVSNAVGILCLLRVVAARAIVDLAPAQEALGESAESLGALLNTALTLLALATAAILATRLVRRGFRLALLTR